VQAGSPPPEEQVMKNVMCAAVVMAMAAAPIAAQDQAAEVMQKARAALGGAKLEQVTALALEGPFAREMGNRQVQGKIELTLQLPGKMHRLEDTEMMGGMSLERVAALNGDTAWEDMQNRGGMGGGVQMVFRQAGPGGQELNAEQIEQARVRRLTTEMHRYLLAFLGGAGLQPTYVAVAEAPEGKADVVEVKTEQAQSVRLFVDQKTSLPLMLQYQELRPRIMMGGPGGRRPGAPGAPGASETPNPEEVRRRMENMPPPQPSNVTLFLGDYKKVDGVMLPHRLTYAVDGKTVEEWTIERARVNPNINADLFDKK
jgi:hypothetical protein